MDRLTGACLRHRRWVVVVWLALTVAGVASAGQLSKRLDKTFSLPGRESYRANQAIAAAYGGGGGGFPDVIVVRLAQGRADSPTARAALDQGFAAVAQIPLRGGFHAPPATAIGGAPRVRTPHPYRVVYPGTAGASGSVNDPRLVSADGSSAYGLVFLSEGGFGFVDPSLAIRTVFTAAVSPLLPGSTIGVTGVQALATDSGKRGGGSSGVLIETLLGALGALIVLAFVFGSFLALLPMAVAVVSITTTFVLVDVLTTFTKVSFIVEFLIALIGLGVAIDYSLLTVTRWREERARGRSNEEAVVLAMRTAGHSVVFSGVTVAVGLFSLVFLPVPFLRSVGYGGMLIPLVSVLVSSTLLPVLLVKIGPFLDHPRRRRGAAISRPWAAWARLVVRRRWVAAGLALVILGALGVSAFQLQVGEPKSSTLSQGGRAFNGLQVLKQAGLPTGLLTPIEILDPHGDGADVVAATRSLPGVLTSLVSGRVPGAVVVDVLPVLETSQRPGSDLIGRVKSAVRPLHVEVGGSGAESQDFNKAVYGSFPLMISIIVVATFLLLARAFRSVLLPAKAVLLNLLSVGATYGVLVVVWQQGHGSVQIWNIPATGAITNFVPLMVFAFLFGLSMDYEVFILARMREEYDTNGVTDAAVVEGIGRTGRLVTSAALILFLAFLSLSQAPSTDIKIFATGLGAGILLDATVVRALLVPALVSMFGRWNWAMPGRFARLLRVQPSALVADRPSPVPELVS